MNPIARIAVVIPCYKVRRHVLNVIQNIGPECSKIYVVDDCCPESSGEFVRQNCLDPRVVVLRNETNQGVGGAVITGYRAAIADEADVIVKIDGDGQMDPGLLPIFVAPIHAGFTDYCKGNRFFNIEKLSAMPKIRLFGNSVLSLISKFSTGYWDLFDPTNGYTAIHADVLRLMPLEKISRRYFFETDMLFRLNTLRARVIDIPMDAKYEDEVSNLKISRIMGEFLIKHVRNMVKRVFYNYYLRDMSLASLELPIGIVMIIFGLVFGGFHWVVSNRLGTPTPTGTVMLSVLPLVMGLQFLLAFIGYDIASVPKSALHTRLPHKCV